MSTEFIFMAATIVFLLMLVGIILTMHEFEKLIKESEQSEAEKAGNAARHIRDGHKVSS
jgi:Na+-transporting methylmalonyl-CoA/oxaloacetate decarboxylase gamma subunit